MKLPEKARHLRVIIAEMNRIASHLVGMGAYGLDLGTFSPFLYAFREREMILDLFEEVCGARLTYSYITIGGATPICRRAGCRSAQQFLDHLKPVIDEYHTLLTTQPDLRPAHGRHRRPVAGDGHRLRLHRARCCAAAASTTTCAATAKSATPRCTTATPSKSSSRKTATIPRITTIRRARSEAILGDCWHRFYVRMLEVVQSIDLVRQAIDRYSTAKGSYGEPVKLTEKLPKGEAYLETEAPRGQMGFYIVSDGGVDSLAGPGPQQFASATSPSPTSSAAAA